MQTGTRTCLACQGGAKLPKNRNRTVLLSNCDCQRKGRLEGTKKKRESAQEGKVDKTRKMNRTKRGLGGLGTASTIRQLSQRVLALVVRVVMGRRRLARRRRTCM